MWTFSLHICPLFILRRFDHTDRWTRPQCHNVTALNRVNYSHSIFINPVLWYAQWTINLVKMKSLILLISLTLAGKLSNNAARMSHQGGYQQTSLISSDAMKVSINNKYWKLTENFQNSQAYLRYCSQGDIEKEEACLQKIFNDNFFWE